MSGGGGGVGKKGGGAQVIGYRYLFGIHMGIGRGPVDELCEIKVGDRTAWSGSVTENQSISVDAYNLFGGEKKEGGIQGTLEVMMGGPAQVAPTGLRGLFGANVPAAVTVAGAPSGNGLYAKGTATDGSVTYSANISGVLWQIRKDGFGRWQIFAGSVVYRCSNTPDVPEQGTGWSSISFTTGSFNYETNQYDLIEIASPLPSLTVSASYSLVPGFRGMFTAFFDGIISMNNPYPKPWKFRVRRSTKGWDGPVWQPGLATITMGAIKAMNPAHILYECLTNRQWGRGLARERLDDAAFSSVATALALEGFGLCLRWNRSDAIESFVQGVLNHIGAAMFTSRSSGLITLRLIRGGYDINTLPHFTPETGLLDVSDSAVATATVNEIQVTYRDPITDAEQSVKVSNLGALQAAGGAVNSISKDYKGIPTAELANRVAQRDLRASSVNLRKFSITLDRRGRSIEPAGVFLISDPARGIPPTPVRAGQIQDGTLTDGKITIAAVQDVFELPQVSWSVDVPSTWVPPDTGACLDVHKVFEIPYFMLAGNLRRADLAFVDENDGFIGTVCGQGKSLNAGYRMAVRSGASTPDDEPNTADFFCGYTP
jgi:hypothetical protein